MMSNKVVRNTMSLYVRLIVTMLVYLFTSKILLQQFGTFDYGIYDVVCGVIFIFSFFTLTFAASSQRFFAFYLGKRDIDLNDVFNTLVFVGIVISLVIFLFAETIGLWFVNSKLNIPVAQINAANFVFQAMLFSYLLNTLVLPFNSFLVADEKMNITSFIGVIDVVLKMLSATLLTFCEYDKLMCYSVLLDISAIIVALINIIYWKHHNYQIRISNKVNKRLLLDFGKYSGWYLFGTLATALREHGVNVLINLFFNPVVNAGRAVAFQVNTALMRVSKSFFEAIRPYIVKTYSQGGVSKVNSIIEISSRFSLYVLLILSVPIIINAERLLKVWLETPPIYAALFLKILLINTILEAINNPLASGIQASGNIKKYHILVSGVYLLNLPISYFVLRMGGAPETTLYVSSGLILMCVPIRLYLCKYYHQLPIGQYVKSVIIRGCLLFIACYCLSYVVLTTQNVHSSPILLIVLTLVTMLLNSIIIFLAGFSRQERNSIKELVKSISIIKKSE